MMCCGGGYAGPGHAPARVDGHGADHDVARVRFTYTGLTALSIVGAVTRLQYRFEGAGSTLEVDRRDAFGLSAVPTLRRIDGV